MPAFAPIPLATDFGTHAAVIGTLIAALAASSITLWLLVRRMTSHRQRVALSDFCRERGFTLRRAAPDSKPPPPFAAEALALHPTWWLIKDAVQLLQLEGPGVPAPATSAAPPLTPEPPIPGVAPTVPQPTHARYSVLVRRIETQWSPTAFRPADAPASVIDPFALPSHPLLNTPRFTVLGQDPSAARLLARSHVRALLPADVGLLLRGRHLVLDFSSRPFDGIEFTRMMSLADQLVSHLPAPEGK